MKNNSTRNTTIILLSVVILSGALFIYTRGTLSKQIETDAKANTSASIMSVTYTCADNAQVEAQYDNTDKQAPKAIVTSGDIKNRVMTTVMSGSGAKYSDGTYVWWTKGSTGFLTEAKDGGKTLVNGCIANK